MKSVISRAVGRGAIALIISLIAFGCTTDVQRQAARGDAGAVADRVASGKTSFTQFEAQELLAICDSLQRARQFDPFFKCFTELKRRAEANGGRLPGTPIPFFSDDDVAFNPAWSQTILLQMRGSANIGVGDLEAAHVDESRALEIARTRKFHLGADPDEDIYGVHRARARLASLGKLGEIEAFWGDRAAALERTREMEETRFSGAYEINAGLPLERDGWLARVYAGLGDWDDAYRVASRQKEETFFSALDAALLDINPLAPIGALIGGGTLNIDDLFFVLQFEPKFLRYRAALETGRLAEAKQGYDEILLEPRVRGYGNIYWRALHGKGRIDLKQGDRATAVRNFETAIQVIESQRRSIGDEGGRVGFVGDKQEVYRDLIDVLLSQGEAAQALAFAERGKARALVDILATKKAFGAADPQARTLLTRFSQEEERRADDARTRSSDLASSANRTIGDLTAQAPELASLVSVKAYTATELMRLVPPGEAAIQYYQQGDALFAFVIQSNGVKSFRLEGAKLSSDVSRFRRAVSRPGSGGYKAAGRRIYDALISPLAGAVSADKVTIVPHGSLHYLPWSAIPTPGGFLIDDWEIAVAPSLSTLAFLGEGPGRTGLLAVGNPALPNPNLNLPGAEAEARAIAQTTPGATLLTGGDATEAAVRDLSADVGVLHLASHGVFDPQDPLSSALLLTAGGGHDGRLTAAEMYDLDLGASLVTLSACETGLGRVQSGDDVIGLIRGLLFAGADNVIASMWLVDDASTSKLMQTFYKLINSGEGVSSALRSAQKELRRAGYEHPYYWAAFQVTGG